jgi:hypothetical protein
MNDDSQKEIGRPKRPYKSPELVRIPLRAEEAVLGHCKKSGIGGPGATTSCHPVGNCHSQGS